VHEMKTMTRPDPFPTIETERLILREITLDDLDWYMRHFSKREMVEGTGFPGPKDRKQAEEEMMLYIIDLFAKGDGFRWGITLRGCDDLIGSCGFYKWTKTESYRAEIGYDLDPECWGSGIMTEALSAMIDFGFEKMGLNRVEAMIFLANERSVALVKRLGFTLEGVFRERLYKDGEFADDACFALLRREWSLSRGR
jgi:ribosomal-protein-alanine N-acetyltransferase